MRPRLIGIGGPSGSGKSTLAAHLAGALPGGGVVLSLDSYYLPLDHLTPDERNMRNFDHPDALDWELFGAQLAALRRGEPVEEPIYRFDRHTRDSLTRPLAPAPFVIVEGILALHSPGIRELLDARVYIETNELECFRRRFERDTRERGRSGESVERQYRATVRPMAESYVWPTRQYADLVVSGEGGYDEPLKVLLGHLASAAAAG